MDVRMPDGTIIRNVPEGVTKSQLMARYSKMGAQPQETYSPTAGMSGPEKFLAGAGEAMTRRAMGLGQLAGMVSPEQIAEQQRLAAPLRQEGAAVAGGMAGDIASLLPAALIPGAATIPGAALIGGATEALTTPGGMGDRGAAAALGATGGAAGQLISRGMSGAMQGMSGLVEPLTQGGRENIVGGTLRRFASDPQAAAMNLQNVQQYVPGSVPTTAEAAQDLGLAQLQRGLLSTPEISTGLAERAQANRSARYQALAKLARSPEEFEAAVRFRKEITEPMYERAFASNIPVSKDSAEELSALLKTPSGKNAIEAARRLAAEEGVDIAKDLAKITGKKLDEVNPRALQYIKWGYDDLLDTPTPEGALGKKAKSLVRGNRDRLTQWIADINPEQAKADKAFSKLSRPIDQIKVGEYIMDKYASELSQMSGVGETPTAFMRALRQAPEQTVKSATGQRKTLEQVFNPKQLKALDGIAKDLARRHAAENLGRVAGSPTAQNLSTQNLLRRTLGPIGFPSGMMEESILPAMMTGAKPLQWLYSAMPEQKIQGLLSEAMLDPALASQLIQPRLPGLYQRAATGLANVPTYPVVGGMMGARE